jgi:hypothetical protein
MYAACFGRYSGYPPACQYKKHTQDDAIKFQGRGELLDV